MGIGILFVDVIGVIGGHQLHLVLPGQGDQGGIHPILVLLPMPHQFHVEVLSELLFPPDQGLFGLSLPFVEEFGRHLTVKVSGQND